jgi:hypothetical protein
MVLTNGSTNSRNLLTLLRMKNNYDGGLLFKFQLHELIKFQGSKKFHEKAGLFMPLRIQI